MSKHDAVNPGHYKKGDFELIDLIRHLPFSPANSLKYLYRYKRKHFFKYKQVEDLKKARWYLRDSQIHSSGVVINFGLICNKIGVPNFFQYSEKLDKLIETEKSSKSYKFQSFIVKLWKILTLKK